MPRILIQFIQTRGFGINAAINMCFSIFHDFYFKTASKVKIKFGNKCGFKKLKLLK